MTRTKWAIPALAGVLILAAAAGFAYWRLIGRSVAVPLAQAAQGQVVLRVVGPGTLQARVPLTLAARITATVKEIGVDVGDAVKRGQVVALLDDRDLAARRDVVGGQQVALARNVAVAQANIARAQADLDLARSKQQRDAELLRTGFVSQAVLDGSNAALQAAAANLDNARASHSARQADAQALSQEARYADTVLSFSRIVAPMDGVVITRLAEVGTTVVPGGALLRLVDPATLWIAMRVDESAVGRVQVGQPASIRMRSGETVTGKVARIARQSDAATRELEVHVAFNTQPARFAIDQEAEVAITAGHVGGVVVPLAALTRDRQGRQGVLAVDGNRAEFRLVQTGASDGQQVVVEKGLAAGERVVARAEGVKAGLRVQVPPVEAGR